MVYESISARLLLCKLSSRTREWYSKPISPGCLERGHEDDRAGCAAPFPRRHQRHHGVPRPARGSPLDQGHGLDQQRHQRSRRHLLLQLRPICAATTGLP